MSTSETTAQPYAQQDNLLLSLIFTWKFSEREMVILDLFRRLSFAIGRAKAPLLKQRHICKLTGLGENHVSEALKRLVHKRVLHVDVDGWASILTDTRFWQDIKPRFTESSEAASLRNWLHTAQPDSPDWFPEPKLIESLIEVAHEQTGTVNIWPTRGAAPTQGGAVRPNQPGAGWDAGHAPLGGVSSRESVKGLVPDHQAGNGPAQVATGPGHLPESGSTSRIRKQAPRSKLPESGSSHKAQIPEGNGPIFPNREGDLPESGSSPLNASSVLVRSEIQDPEKAPKAVETLKGGCRGDRAWNAEQEFMTELIRVLGENAMENWGGFWRVRFRRYPELCRVVLDRLIVRLDNQRIPVRGRGAWMHSELKRGLQLRGLR